MNTIYVVNESMTINTRYGWFESLEECEKRCEELREENKLSNAWFKPHPVEKGVL